MGLNRGILPKHQLGMPSHKFLFFIGIFVLLGSSQIMSAQAPEETFLKEIKVELKKTWPHNRTINLVFHGHSVPTGYFRTPNIYILKAYPYLLLRLLKEEYPTAAINIITTSIGGENSEQGQKRFKGEVLNYKPDVLFIDYALNDRSIGLERSRKAMKKMINAAIEKNIKVILLTPSPDTQVDIFETDSKLQQLTEQIIRLSKKYKIGLVDSYSAFREQVKQGEELQSFMAQNNHPNEKGHQLIAEGIFKYFDVDEDGR